MPQLQYAFPFLHDLPYRPERPERLFFAFFPDAGTAIDVGRFAQEFVFAEDLDGSLLKPERLHVSVQHVGDYKRLRSRYVYAASMAGKAVSMHPFEMAFRFITSFEGAASANGGRRRRPLVLLGEGEAILKFHRILGAAMEEWGLKPVRHMTPHMTLFYGPKAVPMQTVAPIRFWVNEFVLVHSKKGLTQYEMIERWRLH